MNWSNYSSLKADDKVSFAKEKVTVREAVEEVQDSDGKVVQAAEAKEEREYVAFVEKCWNASTGEAMDDCKREYTLRDLENEKSSYDNDIARAQKHSDGLALAIADFKKI